MAEILQLFPVSSPKKQNFYTVLLQHCIDTATLAGRPLSLDLIREILRSAPGSREQLASDAWAAESVCWDCVTVSEMRLYEGKVSDADFTRILNFWTTSFAGQDAGLRGTVLAMLDLLADAFAEPVTLPSAPAADSSSGPAWSDYLVSPSRPTPIPRYLYEPGRKWQKPTDPDDKK